MRRFPIVFHAAFSLMLLSAVSCEKAPEKIDVTSEDPTPSPDGSLPPLDPVEFPPLEEEDKDDATVELVLGQWLSACTAIETLDGDKQYLQSQMVFLDDGSLEENSGFFR